MRAGGIKQIGSLSRWLIMLAITLAMASPAGAQPSDLAVKAAFLPKFAGYVEWPAAAKPATGEPLVICLIGSDPFGRMVDGAARGMQVRRVASASGAAGCNVAFVQGRSAQETNATLAALRTRPVLTVTDSRSSNARGMIHFVIHQGRVRFHIDEAAAARSGLGLSSRLLGVALSVSRR